MRRETTTFLLGVLATGVALVVLLMALVLGFSIEGTARAQADAAKGQQIAVPAVGALVAGVVAVVVRRRGWAVVVGGVAAAAAVVAVLLAAVLPGGSY